MSKKQQRAESQHHQVERHSAPLKEFAAKLEWFLRDQERRERRNRLVFAIAGPALGLLGVFFSKPIAARISNSDLAVGLTPEELNRFVPWLSSVFIMASVLPWLNSANPSYRLHLPKSLNYGRVIRWCKGKFKFVEMSREIAKKLALRSLTVLLLFGVVKVLQSEGLLPKPTPQLWSKPIPEASSGYPEAYFSEPRPAPPARSAEPSTNIAALVTNDFTNEV
jgi:hypothetical protein